MDTIYSYHTFILPFVWKDESNKAKSIGDFTAFFERNAYWTCYDPKDENEFGTFDDPLSYYNEYQYFYPQVRSALYGFDESIVKTYQFAHSAVHNKAHYYIEKKAIDKTYDLLINSIQLKIYNTGIALFVMECENHGTDKYGNPQNTFADVKNINDYGRRITLPFIPGKPDWSICADSLEVYVPELKQRFRTDFRSFIDKISESKQKCADISLNHLSDFIKGILGFSSEHRFSSRIRGADGIIYIHPALDDRMFAASLVIDKKETDELLGTEKDKGEYKYEKDNALSKSLYEFVFMDNDGNCTCQCKKMRNDLLEKHIYKRWLEYGTIYGISAQSLVMLFNGDAMHLVATFLTIYVRMACLCLAQRASLMLFQKETADISRLIHEKEGKIQIGTVTKLMDLQERFSAFESQICFTEITPQEQGIEMYAMFTESFLIYKELDNVKSQIEGLHDATDTYLDFGFNKIALIFTLIGAIFGLASLITSTKIPNEWALPLGSIAVSIAVCIIISFLYRRRYRK